MPSSTASENLTVGLWDPATNEVQSVDLSVVEFDRLFEVDDLGDEEPNLNCSEADAPECDPIPDVDDDDFDLAGELAEDEALALADELGLFDHIYLDGRVPAADEHPDVAFVRALLTAVVRARNAAANSK